MRPGFPCRACSQVHDAIAVEVCESNRYQSDVRRYGSSYVEDDGDCTLTRSEYMALR